MPGSPEEPNPRRRAWGSLSRDQIVAAALKLARRDGMEALSIRRLAAEVGASRMALYRHVPDKDALLGLVADAIAEHDVIPPEAKEGPWQEQLRQLGHGLRRQLLTYPGLADLIMGHHRHGRGALRLVETILRAISEAGLDQEATTRYYLVFVDVVLGRVHREIHGDPLGPERARRLAEDADELAEELPNLRATAPYLSAMTAEQLLDAEMDVIIRAIEGSPSSGR